MLGERIMKVPAGSVPGEYKVFLEVQKLETQNWNYMGISNV